MPKYIVKDAHILHGKKGEMEATLYGPGDEIELTEKEAQALAGRVTAKAAAPKKAEKE